MKKAVYVFGTGGIIILLLSILFKSEHWPGGGCILIYGTLFNCIVVLPIMAIYLFKENSPHKNLNLFGTFSAFILLVGLFFKFMHWPGWPELVPVGTGLFIVFTILFSLNLYKSQK